jgi:hypothetical protein
MSSSGVAVDRASHRRVLALFFARWRKNVNLAVMKQEPRRLF